MSRVCCAIMACISGCMPSHRMARWHVNRHVMHVQRSDTVRPMIGITCDLDLGTGRETEGSRTEGPCAV